MHLQEQLFEKILQRYFRRSDAVEDLCELLNLAKDPIYRRLRGDTFLSPQEMAILSLHYQISLDALIAGKSEQFLCSFNDFSRKIKDFSDYLEAYIADLGQMRQLSHPHLFYASVEVPIFTYAFIPELICFKLYIWGRTTWNLEFVRQRPFEFSLVTAPILRLCEKMLDQYIAIPSTELWSVNIMDNTLAQIEYHAYSGGFKDPNDALQLCDRLIDWINHLRQVAAAGKKFKVGEKPELGRAPFTLYYNEMVHTNNVAYISSDLVKAIYTAYCNPNFIKSTDENLCNYTGEWFQNVMAKSTLISASSEKSRDWFFRELYKKIERVRQRIATSYAAQRE